VDASPVVVGGRVYCGSGVSQTNKSLQVFCLDAATGKRVWARDDIDLPVWGSPAVAGGRVFVGMGNGRLNESDARKPRGAVLCLDAATGNRVWRFDGARDAVHVRAAVDRHHVYVASRDGHAYCLGRRDGRPLWKRDLGAPSVASPALARCSCCGASSSVFVAGMDGVVWCLDPDTGEVFWKHDELKEHGATLVAAPAVTVEKTPQGDRRRVYFASAVGTSGGSVVYSVEDQWHEGE
jgi:outer membrane protein assembly factor BamB